MNAGPGFFLLCSYSHRAYRAEREPFDKTAAGPPTRKLPPTVSSPIPRTPEGGLANDLDYLPAKLIVTLFPINEPRPQDERESG